MSFFLTKHNVTIFQVDSGRHDYMKVYSCCSNICARQNSSEKPPPPPPPPTHTFCNLFLQQAVSFQFFPSLCFQTSNYLSLAEQFFSPWRILCWGSKNTSSFFLEWKTPLFLFSSPQLKNQACLLVVDARLIKKRSCWALMKNTCESQSVGAHLCSSDKETLMLSTARFKNTCPVLEPVHAELTVSAHQLCIILLKNQDSGKCW